MQIEVDKLIDTMSVEGQFEYSGFKYFKGKFGQTDTVVALGGIGKVNAALCAQIMIDKFSVDQIVNTGVAGGLCEEMSVFDIVVAESFVQHDMDASAIGDPVGFVSGVNKINFMCDTELSDRLVGAAKETKESEIFTGVVATGDQFISSREKGLWLRRSFGAVACEMEGGAIAHACCLAGVRFAAIRCISDSANDGANMSYEEFSGVAARLCSEIVLRAFWTND
jgi:adenosylhomocysteine nucleosidase